jgi:hypothetical protein
MSTVPTNGEYCRLVEIIIKRMKTGQCSILVYAN